jgi:hypothetical protein
MRSTQVRAHQRSCSCALRPAPRGVVNPRTLAKGIKVEMEHTTDKAVAERIARHHIGEDPFYYDKLALIEKPKYRIIKKKNTLVNSDIKGYEVQIYIPGFGWHAPQVAMGENNWNPNKTSAKKEMTQHKKAMKGHDPTTARFW